MCRNQCMQLRYAVRCVSLLFLDIYIHASVFVEGCGSESPGENSLRVTPYDVDEAPPSYDTLDRKTILAPPEPALVRLGAIQHIMYSPGGEPEEPVAFGRTAPSTWSGTRDQSIGKSRAACARLVLVGYVH